MTIIQKIELGQEITYFFGVQYNQMGGNLFFRCSNKLTISAHLEILINYKEKKHFQHLIFQQDEAVMKRKLSSILFHSKAAGGN